VDYLSYFETSVAALREERRYRVFANLERQVGSFSARPVSRSVGYPGNRRLVLQ